MKNFTKKRGFFAAAAALLAVTAMLVITWCSNAIGGNNADEFTPPAGKGAVRLSFNKEIARTILPEEVGVLADIDEFEFQFTPATTGTAKTISNIDPADITQEIVLDPGTYNLIVIAYVDVGGGTMEAAATNGTPGDSVLIEAGRVKSANINLKAYAPATGTDKGTFKYTLDAITGGFGTTDTATMTLTVIPGAVGTTPTPVTDYNPNIKSLFGSTAQTLTLAVGYYYVDFVLHVGADTVTFRHVIHIYKNMTSEYTFTVTLNYFNAVFKFGDTDINFVVEDKKPEITYSIAGVKYTYTEKTTISIPRSTIITFNVDNGTTYKFNNIVYSIEWFGLTNSALATVSGVTTLSADNTNLIINTTASDPYNPFSTAKVFNLTVVGETDDSTQYATVIEFSVTPTGSVVIPHTNLTDDTWANGRLAADGTQWFSFTAGATTYIHANDIAVTLADGIDIYVYSDATGTTQVGSTTLPDTGNLYAEITPLSSGTTYYIKVTPHTSSESGTYKIGFTNSITPPSP
ncbi:hypothetical protein [Treponema sp. R80B11-R83G3]